VGAWLADNRRPGMAPLAEDLPHLQEALAAAAAIGADPERETARGELSRLVWLTLDQLPNP
jgi:hypothetical protein